MTEPSGIEAWLAEAVAAVGPVTDPGSAAHRTNRAIAWMGQGRDAEALAELRDVVLASDSEPVAWLALGAACRRQDDLRGWAGALWNAWRLLPVEQDVANLFGEAVTGVREAAKSLAREGRLAEAEDLLDCVLLLHPDETGALHDLGVVVYRAGKLAQAEELFRRYLEGAATPAALCNHGAVLADLGRRAQALAVYRRCARLFPDHAQAYYNAACALAELGRLDEARVMHRRALEIMPDYPQALNNLGNIEGDLGNFAEAVALFRRAVEIQPDYEKANSNLLFNIFYLPETTGDDIVAEARGWGERHGRPKEPALARRPGPGDRGRPIRVGYVSPDFRDHAVSYFLEPVLENHDRREFQVFCYALGKIRDGVTERMKSHGAVWRESESLSDAALADLIRADGIDILVDCAGHSRDNRLSVFALEPAPIQVGNHLGMAGTLGVPTIRHFITDINIAPPGTDGFFTERVHRIPASFMPFRPRPEWPEVAPRADGPPVIACFAEPLRISAPLMEAWRRILDAVPGARLLLKHSRYSNRQALAHYRAMLAPLGDRVDFEDIAGGWGAHWDVYGRVSVMLDSFPVTGATSTVIPLWMGVPVVSAAGVHPGQRFGASMLNSATLPELLAPDLDGYAEIAIGLLRDRPRLDAYRAGLRDRLSASPLLDCKAGTQALEAIYRRLFEEWAGSC